MHLEIESAGHRIIRRERFGQTRQLVGLGTSKQGLKTGFLEGKMPHGLKKVQQNHQRHSEHHEILQSVNHTDRLS